MTILLDGPAVPGSLRRMNRLTILRLLRQMGPVTKPELARAQGVSRPTVSKVVDRLELDGLATAVGVGRPTSSGGKPPVLYEFNALGVRSGAIFLRVNSAQFAVVDGNGHALGLLERPLGADRRPEPVVNLLAETFHQLLTTLALAPDQLLGVGVGVPGLASVKQGVVHFAPHMPEWQNVPLGALLAARLGAEVWVDNDSHVQALAERQFGMGRDNNEFISIQSGVGLSAAYYLHGALYRGFDDTAGEVGHMTIQEDGPACSCGNQGCWEALASTTALVESACRTAEGDWAPPGWLQLSAKDASRVRDGAPLDAQEIGAIVAEIFAAARAGQPEARALAQRHAYHFGVGVASIVNALNPRRIIIWGDSTAGGELFLTTVRDVVRQRSLARPREMCEITFSQLGPNVGLLGAASLAFTALFDGVTMG